MGPDYTPTLHSLCIYLFTLLAFHFFISPIQIVTFFTIIFLTRCTNASFFITTVSTPQVPNKIKYIIIRHTLKFYFIFLLI